MEQARFQSDMVLDSEDDASGGHVPNANSATATEQTRQWRPRLHRGWACAECKRSKLKCMPSTEPDQPCKRCSVKGLSCVEQSVGTRSRSGATRGKKTATEIENLRRQIAHLEQLASRE